MDTLFPATISMTTIFANTADLLAIPVVAGVVLFIAALKLAPRALGFIQGLLRSR